MKSQIITDIKAIEIIDNRAMPTVRAYVCVDKEHWGWADVPCGSSTGSYEAKELRDGGPRYQGKGVRKAVDNIHACIAPGLKGMSARDQRAIDNAMLELDGTPDKSNLGANAILGVSLAVARAAALACRAVALFPPQPPGKGAAGAPGLPDQWRHACRQRAGYSGILRHARGCGQLFPGSAHAQRDFYGSERPA